MADRSNELIQWYQLQQRRRNIIIQAFVIILIIICQAYATSPSPRIPYHTSALSREDWVCELLTGHPDRIRTELGMNKQTFEALLGVLDDLGIKSSRHVSIEEQLAIFLYTVVTGLTSRHVGERFQQSTSTISKYFKRILVALASPPFYTTYVQLPDVLSLPHPEIKNNPKLSPFFDNALGAIDGTHINCSPSAADRDAARNRKGILTQNCLAACTFDLRFTYMLTGWEGSTADLTLYYQSRAVDLRVPNGKYYLADAGFALSDSLLVPYQSVRYHRSEWGRSSAHPSTPEELFNHRHSMARNAVERIFGVLKRRFRILHLSPEYDMGIQARIPAALAALHNFIRYHDPGDIDAYGQADDPQIGAHDTSELGTGPVTPSERERATLRRDRIAWDMWAQYQSTLQGRAAGT